MEIGKVKSEEAAQKALVRFDKILAATERSGVKVVSIEALRKKFDSCTDQFEVFAADLSAWNEDII